MTRNFLELSQLETFEERYRYLRLRASVADPTFGSERYLNQRFYRSTEWRNLRHFVIARDEGRDLGLDGYEIFDRIYIHHMNPMAARDLKQGNIDILDPDYLICVTHRTHNAIHYGDEDLLIKPFVERHPGDTKLW